MLFFLISSLLILSVEIESYFVATSKDSHKEIDKSHDD